MIASLRVRTGSFFSFKTGSPPLPGGYTVSRVCPPRETVLRWPGRAGSPKGGLSLAGFSSVGEREQRVCGDRPAHLCAVGAPLGWTTSSLPAGPSPRGALSVTCSFVACTTTGLSLRTAASALSGPTSAATRLAVPGAHFRSVAVGSLYWVEAGRGRESGVALLSEARGGRVRGTTNLDALRRIFLRPKARTSRGGGKREEGSVLAPTAQGGARLGAAPPARVVRPESPRTRSAPHPTNLRLDLVTRRPPCPRRCCWRRRS